MSKTKKIKFVLTTVFLIAVCVVSINLLQKHNVVHAACVTTDNADLDIADGKKIQNSGTITSVPDCPYPGVNDVSHPYGSWADTTKGCWWVYQDSGAWWGKQVDDQYCPPAAAAGLPVTVTQECSKTDTQNRQKCIADTTCNGDQSCIDGIMKNPGVICTTSWGVTDGLSNDQLAACVKNYGNQTCGALANELQLENGTGSTVNPDQQAAYFACSVAGYKLPALPQVLSDQMQEALANNVPPMCVDVSKLDSNAMFSCARAAQGQATNGFCNMVGSEYGSDPNQPGVQDAYSTCQQVESGQIDCSSTSNKDNSDCDFVGSVLVPVIQVASAAVGIIIIISVVIAGFQYIASNGNPQHVESAKNRLWNTMWALLIFIFGFALLQWLIPGGLFH